MPFFCRFLTVLPSFCCDFSRCVLLRLSQKLLPQSEIPGLVWGEAHKLVPVAFGVKKLVLSCVVEDDKVMFFSTV